MGFWWPGSFLDEMAVLFLEMVWVQKVFRHPVADGWGYKYLVIWPEISQHWHLHTVVWG